MYDMYPDWGPAKHRTEHAFDTEQAREALQVAFDGRDASGPRPDDN